MHLTVQWYLTLLLLRYGTAGMGALCRFALEYRLTVTVFFWRFGFHCRCSVNGGIRAVCDGAAGVRGAVPSPRLLPCQPRKGGAPDTIILGCTFSLSGVHTLLQCQIQYYTHCRVGGRKMPSMHAHFVCSRTSTDIGL